MQEEVFVRQDDGTVCFIGDCTMLDYPDGYMQSSAGSLTKSLEIRNENTDFDSAALKLWVRLSGGRREVS